MRQINGKLCFLTPRIRLLAVTGILLSVGSLSGPAADETAGIDSRADELLRRTSDYLAQAPFYSVNAEVWQDAELDSGQRFQATRTIDLEMRRPNRLHFEVRSTRHNRGIWYDGKSLSILNRNRNLYGTAPAPGTLDEMLDVAAVRFGMTIPLEDLMQSNPYTNAVRKVSAGTYLGPTTVLGVSCEHLAFTQTNIDWQVWIEDGPKPVPRKIVITYKDEAGSPEYMALLSKWDFVTKLPDFVFNFEPPPGAQKIDMVELRSPTGRNR